MTTKPNSSDDALEVDEVILLLAIAPFSARKHALETIPGF